MSSLEIPVRILLIAVLLVVAVVMIGAIIEQVRKYKYRAVLRKARKSNAEAAKQYQQETLFRDIEEYRHDFS